VGKGFDFECKNCNFSLSANLGIGFGYPNLCTKILDNIKNGTLGKELQEIADNINNLAIYASQDLYLCENCRDLSPELTIALCSPLTDLPKSDRPFSSVCECSESDTYVMEYQLGTEYKTELIIAYFCDKCKTKMTKVTSYENLECPHCRSVLDYEMYCWD